MRPEPACSRKRLAEVTFSVLANVVIFSLHVLGPLYALPVGVTQSIDSIRSTTSEKAALNMRPLSVFCQAIVLLAVLSNQAIVQAQWPQFGGEKRDFRASQAQANSQLKTGAWSMQLGLGDAPPVVDRDQLFVTESAFTDDGQEAMLVRCLNLADGHSLWSSMCDEQSFVSQDISPNYPVRPLASPVVVSHRVVAVSYGGCVSCLDQSTGDLLWKHDLVKEFSASPMQFGWSSSPWTDGNIVVVACGGPQAMIVAFSLTSGALAWQSQPGEAAYGSFCQLQLDNDTSHLCYVGRDMLVGLNSVDGKELWSLPLPKPGLTNAVTPIPLPNGHLLVSGQGFEGSRRLHVHQIDAAWKVDEVWKSRSNMFYCNWIADAHTQQLFAYHSNYLGGLDLDSGELKWRSRGWTDANFSMRGDTVVGIRGDGYLALATLTHQGLNVRAGAQVVNDRVWTPPVIINDTAIVRGRKTLAAIPLDRLPELHQMRAGTEVSSMNVMYGENHEWIVALMDKVKTSPSMVQYEDYTKIVSDGSIRFGEKEYRSLLEQLLKHQRIELAAQIATDWVRRDAGSIEAFDQLLKVIQLDNQHERASALITDRMVDVEIDVTVPAGQSEDANLYLAGNASSVGDWKPNGVPLTRSEDGHYRAKVKLPKGRFEFKITQGDSELVEARNDGRGISNRRRLVTQPTTIQAEVAAWKSTTK